MGIGAGAVGALGVGGCGTSSRPRVLNKRSGAQRSEAPMLNRLLGAEYHAIAAYTAATPLLAGTARRAAQQFLGQEVLHTDRLLDLIQRSGGHPVQPKASYDLGQPRGTPQLIQLLLAVERLQLATYLQVAPSLDRGSLRATAASILANHAQHAAILRLQLGRPAAPSALVTGDEYR
jgi:hypothetical protein